MKRSLGWRNLGLNFGLKAVMTGVVLVAAAGRLHAQSADALIDKLVDKGILSEKEAQDLRDESDQNFTSAFQSKMGMPDWVSGYKLSGDFRGRVEQYSSQNSAQSDRVRFRYRLRVGLIVSMFDHLEVGFRLGSGDVTGGGTTGSPLSDSSTFQGDFTKKSVYIDAAYGKWSPINSDGWQASITVGKMDSPFSVTPMILDVDLTPEGVAVQTSHDINDKHKVSLNGAVFVLNDQSLNGQPASEQSPYIWGGQFLWTAKWAPKFSTTAGVGAFNIQNPQQLMVAGGNNPPPSVNYVPLVNVGNTRTLASIGPSQIYSVFVPQDSFTPVFADVSATYTLDTFPLYSGAFPITFTGEFLNNVATAHNNYGYWAGIKFGKSGTKRTWDISYRYEYLESDAQYDQLVDDDNVAFDPGNLGNPSYASYGLYGGTNIKGHLITFNYSFTDSLTFSFTCYINDLISLQNISPTPLVPGSSSSAIHFMADMNWKF